MRIKKYQNPDSSITLEDLDRNNWRWSRRNELKKDDPLISTLGDNDKWIVDKDGNLVPTEIVNKWLNSYERQIPYQTQNDIEDAREMAIRKSDREANAKSPGFWTVAGIPAISMGLPILAYEATAAVPAIYGWLTNTAAGQSLIASTLGGETLNTAARSGGYESTGHLAYLLGGGKDWENLPWYTKLGLDIASNPGYGISRPVRELMNVATEVAKPYTESILNQYSKNMFGIDPLAIKYVTNKVKDVTTNGLKLKAEKVSNKLEPTIVRAKDIAFLIKNAVKPTDESVLLPSLRKNAERYKKIVDSTTNYVQLGKMMYVTTPKNTVKVEDIPINSEIKVREKMELGNPHPQKASMLITPELLQALLKNKFPKDQVPEVGQWATEEDLTYYQILLNGLKDKSEQPVYDKIKFSSKVLDVDKKLLGLGHVTGSHISAEEPFALHTPQDIDVITTENNLEKVINILEGKSESEIDSSLKGHLAKMFRLNNSQDHIKITSPKYGEIDIQIIRNGSTPNSSKGLLANETYAKLYPEEYSKMHNETEDFPEINLSPQELLQLHKLNRSKIVRMDQTLSGKDKHIERDIRILSSSDPNIIQRAINEDETLYKSVFGNKFLTLEDLGVNIDYKNVLANYEFLKKLLVDDDVAKKLAQDPTKMEYIIKSIVYEKSTSVRSINLDRLYNNDRSKESILKAIHSNSSYANHGGNSARERFGGDSWGAYAGREGITSAFLFPIKNPEKIHNAMDLYREMWRYNTGPSGTLEQKLQMIDFILPTQQSEEIRRVLRLPSPPKTLNDIVPYFDQDNAKSRLGITSEQASQLNDMLANILNVDYINSNQAGFGNLYVGIIRSNIPGQVTVMLKSGSNNPNFIGFELPRHKFDIARQTTPNFEVTSDKAGKIFDKIEEKAKSLAKAKLEKADALRSQAESNLDSLYFITQAEINSAKENLKKGTKLASFTGAISQPPLIYYIVKKEKDKEESNKPKYSKRILNILKQYLENTSNYKSGGTLIKKYN